MYTIFYIINILQNLVKYGLIKQVTNGMYAFLPLGLRVINKLVALVDVEMEKIQAQKMLLPALTPTHLWKKTERFNDNANELFKVQDRSHRQYILSPVSFQLLKRENIGR